MGDSDDEFEKRRRDKFRRERNDYERRGGGGDRIWEDRSRGDWPGRKREFGEFDRGRGGGGPYRSPQRYGSPPTPKRMRRDWDDGAEAGSGASSWQDGPSTTSSRQEMDYPTQPPMMSFKSFLTQQDDNISDDEAIKKYQEYKLDFKKQQINEFFLQHKEEEWFKTKYLPEEHTKRKEEAKTTLQRRCDVFMTLVQLGWLDKVTTDTKSQDELIKLLDAAVILMEGGTEFDLKSVEEEIQSEESSPEKASWKTQKRDSAPETPTSEAAADSSSQDKKEGKEEGEESPEHQPDAITSEEAADSSSQDKKEGKEEGEENTSPEKSASEEAVTVEEDSLKPKPYHKTQSIFLRNLAPNITKAEVEAMCKKYGGFLRVALQDPAPERKFFRRGWVTFDRTVNIKDICWKLTNIRLRDCELGAIVNRELKQRVRPVNGTTAHRQVAKNDIKFAAKIIQTFDQSWGLWAEDPEKKDEQCDSFGLVSSNPMLKNITDYLVDEGNFEEEAYLGQPLSEQPKDGNPEIPIERDEELLMVLDRMILYLRVVHSFDYYSAVEYPNEDEMPHRCGIIHARGPPPPNRLTQGDIDDWVRLFENKIVFWTKVHLTISDEDSKRLGLKDPETEVEKFIQANTQELAKDKWLCPLSGKKFKGPEFVRKHILNKNGDKVEEVKKEAVFFNNYLMDPKRPQLPDHPANKNPPVSAPRPQFDMPPPQPYHPPPYQGGYQGGYQGNYGGGFRGGYYGRARGGPPGRGFHPGYRGGFNNDHHYKIDFRRDNNSRGGGGYERFPRRDRNRPDPRGIVEYRDLDSVEEKDAFFVVDKA